MSAFTLMSDVRGAIQEVALIVWQSWLDDPSRRAALESLVASTGTARLVVVVKASTEPKVSTWLQPLAPGRFRICAVDDAEFDSSGAWARDSFLNATEPTGSRLIVHPRTGRPGKLALWLSSYLSQTLENVAVSLDGGDSLVIDENHWIVGAGAVDLTMRRSKPACTWAEAVQQIEESIGRKATVAGHRRQPAFQRLLTLGDRVRWKMAAPCTLQSERLRWPRFFNALRDALRETFAPAELFSDWPHIDMVVSATGVNDSQGKPVVLVADPTAPECPQSDAAKRKGHRLDSLAQVLAEAGFAVKRNPTPYVLRRILPYNNTVVQIDQKTVWLPTFAAPDLDVRAADQANVSIWRSLGFADVRPVQGWSAFVSSEGSVRCATLPLTRL